MLPNKKKKKSERPPKKGVALGIGLKAKMVPQMA